MKKSVRILSGIVLVAVIFISLASLFFVASASDHDCVGEDCRICYQIAVCENLLKLQSLILLCTLFLTETTGICERNTQCDKNVASSFSLVSLKVKLSD